jgi:hypothetical protein
VFECPRYRNRSSLFHPLTDPFEGILKRRKWLQHLVLRIFHRRSQRGGLGFEFPLVHQVFHNLSHFRDDANLPKLLN